MEYRIVEAWGAMRYYFPEEKEPVYEDTDDSNQGYWVVAYDPDEKEIIDWLEMFSDEEQANTYKQKLEEQ